MYASSRHPSRPDEPVRRVMTWPVATVDADASLVEVAEALAADEIGVVLVLSEGSPAGVLSERDVVAHVALGSDLAHLRAGDVMSGSLVTAQVDDRVVDVAITMIEAQVRHLPVLDGDLVAGLVSMRDVVAVLTHAVHDDDEVVVVPSGTRIVVRST